jgi:DNA repair protein SbcD/Mre11
MRLVHMADLHLGRRQHERLASDGVNQREADVALAFTRAIDTTIAIAPELVVIAGDIFDAPKPPVTAILHANAEFYRLRRALPDAAIVMVAGNHDTPRVHADCCLLAMFREMDVRVADREAQRFGFPSLDLAVLAVPECVRDRPSFEAEARVSTNILLTHLAVTDVCPIAEDALGLSASIAEMGPERWDYIAVGHYHVYRELAPNASYAGSIEYTSSDPWGELREQQKRGVPGKGLVEFDLATGERTFHPIEAPRAFVDLEPIGAHGMTAAELDAAIQAQAATVPDGAVVRQLVQDAPRDRLHDLDYRAIRSIKRRCLHYQLDTRKQEIKRLTGVRTSTRRKTLDEEIREFFAKRVVPSDVSRDDLVRLSVDYLDEAAAQESRRPSDAMIEPDVQRQEVA